MDNQGNCWFATARGVEKLCFFPQSYQFNLTDYEAETRAFLQDSHNPFGPHRSLIIFKYCTGWQLGGIFIQTRNITKEKQAFFNGVYLFWKIKKEISGWGQKDCFKGISLAVYPCSVYRTIYDGICCMDDRGYFNGLMALPNLVALVALSGVVVAETKKYFEKQKY